MTHRSARPAFRLLAWTAVAAAALLLGPTAALAHASLVTSDPASGATLATSPVTISATYAEAFDTTRSSMVLLGPDGATLATNAPATVATADSMTISGFGTLAAGMYLVRWTTITPDDNGIERGTFTFTVVAATPSAGASSAAPGVAATATASPAPGGSATSGGAGDIAVPLVVLVALVVAGTAWFLRRAR